MELPKMWKDVQVQTSDGEEARAIGDVHSPEEQSRETYADSASAAESIWQAEKYYGRAEDLQSHTRRRIGEQYGFLLTRVGRYVARADWSRPSSWQETTRKGGTISFTRTRTKRRQRHSGAAAN